MHTTILFNDEKLQKIFSVVIVEYKQKDENGQKNIYSYKRL